MSFDVQGILKLGQSREEKLRRVALKIDEADITFALQVHKTNLISCLCIHVLSTFIIFKESIL